MNKVSLKLFFFVGIAVCTSIIVDLVHLSNHHNITSLTQISNIDITIIVINTLLQSLIVTLSFLYRDR